MKRINMIFLFIVMAFVANSIFPNMINATPTISLDVDLWTDGTNPIHNYAMGIYDTGKEIYLQPGEEVWIDLYLSGFNEAGNGLVSYSARITWDSSQLTASNLSIPFPPWLDCGNSTIGDGYVDICGFAFPPGSAPEGDDILLARFKLKCIGLGTSPLTIYNWPQGDANWLTLQGEALDGQVNKVLATITNVAPPCGCDLNNDGRCNMVDWQLFGQRWGATNCNTVPCACDLNDDGRCNMSDWLLFGKDWGRTDCLIIIPWP